MSDQPEITNAELNYWETLAGSCSPHPQDVGMCRLIDEMRRLRAENARLAEWKKIANEYVECLQHLCMNVMYEPCVPISHKWPGRKHVECIKEGVKFLLTENARLRIEISARDVEKTPMREEFECHSDDAREDS